jgi:hypothetical protein
MKSIRRSFMYVFAIICGLTFCGNTVLAAEEMMAKGMVKGNLVVSGDVEVNTNVETKDMDGVKSTINSQTGRGKLKFEANSGMMGNLYVAGEGAIEAKQDGSVGGGDYFFRLGGSDWDLTVGRKGGEGLYTSGQDIAYADAGGPGRYAVDYASQAAVGGFNLTFSPSDVMKFQLRIQHGTVDAGTTKDGHAHRCPPAGVSSIPELLDESLYVNCEDEDSGEKNNQIGFRPWMSVSLGGIGIVAAYESVSESAQDSGRAVEKNKSGYGLKVTGDVGAIKLGVNYTSGNDENDVTTNSTGGFVTVGTMAGSFGIGLHRDSKEDASEQNTFVSYVAPLPVEGSHVKVGYGVSTAGDNEVGLFRIRFNYAF